MKFIVIVFLTILRLSLHAQVVEGKVMNAYQEMLPGATVMLAGTGFGVISDGQGNYALPLGQTDKPFYIVASFVGYQSDSILYDGQRSIDFVLKMDEVLSGVTISARKEGIIISSIKPIKVEQITEAELSKAACCDLAGCFNTQLSVHPQTTNIITNSTELRLLGLGGVYNQILVNGLPSMQGPAFTYGMSSIPGTLIDNIFVSKGSNSVLQGFESISGQLNVTTKDPSTAEKWLVNGYINNFYERHLNVYHSFQKNKWHNITAVHAVQPSRLVDRDQDTFLDLPLLTRYMFHTNWKYGNELDWGWSHSLSARYVDERRVGGQINFDPAVDTRSNKIYGQLSSWRQPELSVKSAFRLNDEHQLSVQVSSYVHDQTSYFGTTRYDANQQNVYANIQYAYQYKGNDLKTGLSYRHMHINENVEFGSSSDIRSYNGVYNRQDKIAGLFAENTMHFFESKLTWMSGLRYDRHQIYGGFFTPRMLVKYDITPNTIVRANIGTGWRVANILSENIWLMVSSRDILFGDDLRPEQARNMGINLTHKFENKNGTSGGQLSVDIYKTSFSNQIFPNLDSDPSISLVENFMGISKSNNIQIEALFNIWSTVELKGGYTFQDVYRRIGDVKQLLPFIARHRLLSTFNYKTLDSKFQFDMNAHWYGPQTLPNTQSNPEPHRRPDVSESFAVVNTQVKYNFPTLSVYVGCENIFDFRQLQPIIGWEEPFGAHFDASSVWGPTRGREVYIGMTWKIAKEQ